MGDRVKPSAPPTQERLKELFDYNPETGDFVRRVSVISSNGRAGRIAGATDTTGYRQIRVNGWLYRAHVLAWVYMTGEYPKDMIDHVDMNRSNNAFSNPRECTTNQNQYNTAARKANKLGIKNVHQMPCGKYAGTVKKNDKQHRKVFVELSDAIAWVQAKRIELHGEFAYVDRSAPAAKREHILYRDGDSIGCIPESILDRNGQVALAMCSVCGKAESELYGPCEGAPAAKGEGDE